MKKVVDRRHRLLAGISTGLAASMLLAITALGGVIEAPGAPLSSGLGGPGTVNRDLTQEILPEETRVEGEISSQIDIVNLQAAQDTDQVIVVVGSGMDSSQVTVTYFKKEESVWREVFHVPGYCGKNGMSAEKREGDRKTPIGTFQFTQAFGSLEDPGSKLSYKQLDDRDYWVDDSNSVYYNQMVNTAATPVAWNSAEHLINIMPQYHYSLALNYNTQERIPGKGSAIFLHGYHTTKTWSEGCLAIPEENMKLLVQQVDEKTKIVIVPEMGALQ